jgi:hypothetical protein
MLKLYSFIVLFVFVQNIQAQSFMPKDTVLGSNFFQVEFSQDMRSMVWCEQIPLPGGRAKVFYANVDLETGLPDIAAKKLIDTIQGQGWPYWGADQTGVFFLIKNQYGVFKYIRRLGINTLQSNALGTANNDIKSLINVSSDTTKPYFWINYVVLNANAQGKDSLFALRSDQLGVRIFINSERKNQGGSAYELTFPRWLAYSDVLAYPFRSFPAQPYWDMKFWKGANQASTQVTNDIPNGVLNHHVDDLPFRVPQFPDDTFMFSSRGATKLAIYKKNGTFFIQSEQYTPLSAITPATLTSFEPFTINSNRTYGAYQVYSGGGIPGNTAGEIWLKGIFGEPLHVRLSQFEGDVAVDPEYVVGNNKVWVFYYGKPVGNGFFNLHRCETPLKIGTTSTIAPIIDSSVLVFPNPVNDYLQIQTDGHLTFVQVGSMDGQLVYEGRNTGESIDVSALKSGVYWVRGETDRGPFIVRFFKL